MEKFTKGKKIGSWNYSTIDSDIPLIHLIVQFLQPNSLEYTNDIELIVDTGYEGEVLLSYNMFMSINYINYTVPDVFWADGVTVTGETIILTKAKAIIKIGTFEYEIFVESHQSVTENIIGRKLFNRFFSELHGPNEKWELFGAKSNL